MYICELCNYQTEYSGNYCNHKKTKKHLKLETKKSTSENKNYSVKSTSSIPVVHIKSTLCVDKNYSCKNCDFSTTHKSSYYRHTKTCSINLSIKLEHIEKEKELYKKLEQEKSEMLNNFMNNLFAIICMHFKG